MVDLSPRSGLNRRADVKNWGSLMRKKKRKRFESSRATSPKIKRHAVVSMNGDPCLRCSRPTEAREHVAITDRILRQPFYYSRWFYCRNPSCRTTTIMPERFKVTVGESPPDDIALEILDQMNREFITDRQDGRPPWED